MATSSPSPFRAEINAPVFLISAALIAGFVIFGAAAPGLAGRLFDAIQTDIVDAFGWFYLAAMTVFLVFVIALAMSSYGLVKLGPDHSEPDFSNLTWFAMLFSRRHGHRSDVLRRRRADHALHVAAGRRRPARSRPHAQAMQHHLLSLGPACLGDLCGGRHCRWPISASATAAADASAPSLYPLIGERIHGPIGHAVDIFAVLGTMFGIATSLGLGVIADQFRPELTCSACRNRPIVQLVLIAGITLLATGSVVSRPRRAASAGSASSTVAGGRRCWLFVLIAGPTVFLLQGVRCRTPAATLNDLVDRTFNLYAYEPQAAGSAAGRCSTGRGGSPGRPSSACSSPASRAGARSASSSSACCWCRVGFTFIWMTVFGNTAISLDMGPLNGAISAAVAASVPTALFQFLEALPLSLVTSVVATLLVVTFFITSADSGSLVIDTITSGGAANPPVWQRIFWAVDRGTGRRDPAAGRRAEGLADRHDRGGLALHLRLLLVCYGLAKALRMETRRRTTRDILPDVPVRGSAVTWQQRLATIVSYPGRDKAETFLRDVAVPALKEVAQELSKTGVEAKVEVEDRRVILQTMPGDAASFYYAIRLRGYETPSFAFPELPPRETPESERYYRAEVHLQQGSQGYDMLGYGKEQIIADVLSHFQRHMHILHVAS